MNKSRRWSLVLLLLLPLVVQADLTGRWQGNDGGVYYVRQAGDQLHWYAEQNTTMPRWAHVFHGSIRGDRISGEWLDVPKGQTTGQGKLSLVIRSNGQVLERSRETGGFGPSRWTRMGPLAESAQAAPLMPLKPLQPQATMPVTVLKEDCIGFNPANIAVVQAGNRWKIADGNHWMFDFAGRQDEALQAHRILRHYGMNQSCFVGRPQPALSYMLTNGTAPAGRMRGEDCVAFNTADITVVQAAGRWKIADGSHWLFDFGDSQGEAEQALAIMKKYGFTHSCYVGRPQASFTYLRR